MSEVSFGEGNVPVRIRLVVRHPGLRSDLVRALESSGYVVVASSTSKAPEGGGPAFAASLLDIDAFSDEAAIAEADGEPERVIWLVGDPGSLATPLPDAAGVLVKPFSIQALEFQLRACLASREASRELRHEPILVSRESSVKTAIERGRRVARQESPVVIEGELGSGRRALARAIHAWSPRAREATFTLDRAEAEAAGGRGARSRIDMAFDRSTLGSLILVEPADWALECQRALSERLRQEGPRPRLLTLARKPLEECVAEGALSAELQYRLEAVSIVVPPLRDRPRDHFDLCTAIARRVARSLGRPTPRVDSVLVESLAMDGFPGNQLGLESRLRSAIIRSESEGSRLENLLEMETSPSRHSGRAGVESLDLKRLERDTIVRALAHWEGNRTRASESLGISVRTLRNKIREYELR